MASYSQISIATLLLVAALTSPPAAQASDPELTSDFAVPEGLTALSVNSSYFTFTGFRALTPSTPAPPGPFVNLTGANLVNFPALEGLGVSFTLGRFPGKSVNRPHTHPRGTEIIYVLEGTIDVGFVAANPALDYKLYYQTLQTGDVFVFPKGLVHYQINRADTPARTIAAFSSSNAGTISLPSTIFGSTPPIDDETLTISFQVDQDIITALKAPYA